MTKAWEFHGIIPAAPTPFHNGKLDLDSYRKLMHYLQDGGVHGVVVCGSTGEGATVTDDEFKGLMDVARQVFGGEVPVIAGVGTNSTVSTIERSRMAHKCGADGLLVVTPYYNKPPQEGLYQHFKAVAAATELPIILYNVPGRTACNLLPETVERLAQLDNVVAIKEASASLGQCMEIMARCTAGRSSAADEGKKNAARRNLTLLSGEDLLFLPMLSVGCTGVITVLGNVVPREMVQLYEAWKAGDVKRAESIHYWLRELCEWLFVETNPIPLKAALHKLNIFTSAEARQPLCDLSERNRATLETLLKKMQLQPASVRERGR